MSTLGGYGGHVSKGTHPSGGGEAAIGCVRQWSVNAPATVVSGVCSASSNAEFTIPGNYDWSGSYRGYGPLPSIMPGDLFFFGGAITGAAVSAVGIAGPAICDGIRVLWDMENAKVIEHEVMFGGTGALTRGTITVPADATVPAPAQSKGMKVELATDPFSSFSEIPEVRTITLSLSRANPSHVAAANSGWAKRVLGPLSGTVDLTVFADDADGWASFPEPNTYAALKLYTKTVAVGGADEFWLVKFVVWTGHSGCDVDIETGAVIPGGLSAKFSAVAPVSNVWTKGSIAKPGGASWWP